ncbi:MAG TPA: tetratricopeptide repeat protein [Terriglobia bacterium]|nr:tetratricopeptide repeat protein [Terriglobia bacterium]
MLIHLFLVAAVLVGPVEAAQSDFEAGRYDDAIKALLAVHQMAPEDPAVNYWLSRSYYEENNYELAVAYGQQAVKIASQNAEYHRWLGRAYGAKAEQSHSFFLARKVKKAFEAAVSLAPLNIAARRDLMQYLVEAPWLVGGDKEKAKEQIASIAELDPIQGRLARAAFLSMEQKWREAEVEYLTALDQHPDTIESYIETADFFVDRKDAVNLELVLAGASRCGFRDPPLEFYCAVVLVLRRADLSTAEGLLPAYLTNVPERSDYPSHKAALTWSAAARKANP